MTITEQRDIAEIVVASGSLASTDREGWTQFALGHSKATLFHLLNWSEAIADAHGHRPHFLRCYSGKSLRGIMPLVEIKSRLFGHALISTAFGVSGGPVANEERSAAALLAEATRLAAKCGADYVEIRDAGEELPDWPGRSNLYATFERQIEVDDQKCLLQIPRKQRAVVRKALDRDFTITIDQDIETFYGLFSRTARDHGTPVFAKRHFQTLMAAFPGSADVLTVRENGVALSSVFSFYFRDRVMPYYTGSRVEARAAGSNDLMYWKLMRHSVGRGCRIFDFGRSKVGTGPYSFKKNWGFEPRPITHRFHLLNGGALPNVSPANPKFSALVSAWRRLPLPVANAVSPFISRYLG